MKLKQTDTQKQASLIEINGYSATVNYDESIKMWRGEFIGLKDGSADFYAKDLDELRKEGEISLRVFLTDPETKQGLREMKDEYVAQTK